MTDESVFNRDPSEWSDDEIRVGIREVGKQERRHRAIGKRDRAEFCRSIVCELANERDRRAAVGHAVDMAVDPAVWLDDVS